jgi:hypothetical protein
MVMSRGADVRAEAVATGIARYLSAHPDAADTLEGAARWWITPQPSLDVMASAMTLLESRQIVEKHILPGGTAVFRSGPGLPALDDES